MPAGACAPNLRRRPGCRFIASSPLRIGVVGLPHPHVHWLLVREKLGDIAAR